MSSALRFPIRAKECRFALEGFYSYGRGPNDFSIRGGWSELSDETFNGSIGAAPGFCWAEISGPALSSYSESFPLDGALTVGLGANVGDGDDAYSSRSASRSAGASIWKIPRLPSLPTPIRSSSRRSAAATAMWISRWVWVWTCGSARTSAVRVSGGVGDIEGLGIAATYIK